MGTMAVTGLNMDMQYITYDFPLLSNSILIVAIFLYKSYTLHDIF